MKLCKKLFAIMCIVTILFSTFSICAEAASVYVTDSNYGYMMLSDRKVTKKVSSTKLYGNYDYLNFIIKSKTSDRYFFYELYSDSKYKNLVASDGVYCESSGTYSYSSYLNLKSLKTKTYYLVTYSAYIASSGDITVSAPSMSEYKVSVNKSPSYKDKTVILKSITNTTNGPKITWQKLSNDTSKYIIYRRSLTGTKWTNVGTVKGSTLSFTDKKIKNSTGKYVYSVKGVNKKGTTSSYHYSGLVCLYTPTPTVKSVATTYDNQVKVTWNNTYKSAKYNIYRKENNGDWKLIKKEHNSTTYYDNTAKVNGNNYCYTVRGVVNTNHGKATSSFYNGSSLDFIEAPVLNIVEINENSIKFNWNAVEGAEYYSIYRKEIDTDKWSNIGKLSKDVLEYYEEIPAGKSYDYSIRAEGEKYRGSYSNTGVRHFYMQPVKNIEIEAGNGFGVSMKWDAVPYATKYDVFVRNGTTWSKLKSTTETKVGVESFRLQEKTYGVRAIRNNVVGEIYASEPFYCYPYPSVSVHTYSDYLHFQIADGGAEEYRIYRKLNNSKAEYEFIGSTTDLSFKDYDVKYDVEYMYCIKGVYDGIEQTNNWYEQVRIKYSLDKYLKGYNPRIIVTNESKEPAYVLTPNTRTEEADKKGFYNGYYYQTANGEIKKILMTNGGYNTTRPKDAAELPSFACVVGDFKGTTPIDLTMVQVDEADFQIPEIKVETKADGTHVTWKAVEGAKKYQLIIEESGQKLFSKTVMATDKKTYDIVITQKTLELRGSMDFVLTAVFDKGHVSRCYEDDIACWNFYPAFQLTATKGKITIKPTFYGWGNENVCNIIYRKAEGSSKWEKIYMGRASSYVDTNVKSGKKYTYAVRRYDTERQTYSSYFRTKTITAK